MALWDLEKGVEGLKKAFGPKKVLWGPEKGVGGQKRHLRILWPLKCMLTYSNTLLEDDERV